MKTNRSIMFVVIVLSICLVFVSSVWSAEQKSAPGRQQIVVPAAVAPAKTQSPIKEKVTASITPQVIVDSPIEGATYYGGQTCDIRWKALGIPAGAKMKIEFIRSDSTKLTLENNLSIPGNLQWKINEAAFLTKEIPNPYGGMSSYTSQNTQGKLKLTVASEGKTYESERSISILIPGLKITNPAAGVTWQVGQTYTVTWQNIGPPVPMIDILIGAGAGYGSIPSYVSKVANTGSASFTLPASVLFENWTGSYWLSVQSSSNLFPENYIFGKITMNITK